MRAVLFIMTVFALNPQAFAYDWNSSGTETKKEAVAPAAETAIFQALLGEMDQVKLDWEGYSIHISRFLGDVLKRHESSLLAVSNKCTVRDEPTSFECVLTLNVYKRKKSLPEIASHQVLYRTTGTVETGVEFNPADVAFGAIRDGLRMPPDYELAALKRFLNRLGAVNISDKRQEPLAEFLAEDLVNQDRRVVSVRQRCRAVESVINPECALTMYLFRTPKKGLPLEATYTLTFNAGFDPKYGASLARLVKKAVGSISEPATP